ncbi:NAD-dependent epimerase/dehydratase family protein [Bacillus sp. FJAT-27245]|uniref:NAD-dependent epimerase/dehydratase family protein n=1 Tax=Bacillus sp. FJAT-27245 TaxID=1684144 RepID=UPI0009EB3999|nr:NmrA family NAD(P)-binding protein [Bacillus sp. FJAT-27245]
MILVTGITGHSGRHFLQVLIKDKYDGPIRCIVRNNSDRSLLDNSGLNIEVVIGDLENQETMNSALSGIDTVVHIASIFYSVTVIKAAIKNGVKRAILVHTTGIYSKYKSASEEYKHIEQNIESIKQENNSKIGVVFLRPTMIYGNINDRNMIVFIKMVDKLKLFPIINHGRNQIQPVNGRDLGKAYYQVLMKAHILNGDYILSGEKPISMKDLFKLIGRILDKKTTFISVPLEIGVILARILKVCSFGKIDFIEKVQRMGEDRSFPHEKAAKDFGYKPMPLSEGLKLEIKEYLTKVK